MTHLQQLIHDHFAELKPQFDHPLASHTYFKTGGKAAVFIQPQTQSDFIQLINFCQQHQLSHRVIGGASNLLVQDEPLNQVIIQPQHHQFTVTDQVLADQRTIIQAESGLKTALLVRKTVDAGFQGLEYFLGVPGNLGGAVYNNAHYLQALIGDFIHRVKVLDQTGETTWLNHDECQFGYDQSRFHHSHEVILEVEFALLPGKKTESEQKIKEATQYRAATQPLGLPSSGCIFRNVPNNDHLRQLFPQFADKSFVPAGFLIDQAGLKGTKIGEIEVSHKHAAFMVNHGSGTTNQAKALISQVKHTVHQQFGVELEEEVFYV